MKERRSKAKGKKFATTDPKTGKTVNYGATGYTIGRVGSAKQKSYCARSAGIVRKYGYDCSGADKYKPACLSRKKWKC